VPDFDVVFASPWGVACGLSTYGENLVHALGLKVLVAAERPCLGLKATENCVPSIRCWDRLSTDYSALLEVVRSSWCRLLHVNFEYGLFPDSRFGSFVLYAQSLGIRVVLTVHSILSDTAYRSASWSWIRPLFRAADAIIVHSVEAAKALDRLGCEVDRVYVVPHGVVRARPCSKTRARKRLGLPKSGTIAASVGFITRNKGLLESMEAILRCPEIAAYVIAGWATSADRSRSNQRYAEEAERLAATDRRIRFLPRFLSDREVRDVMSAADFGIYQYQSPVVSTSGAARLCLSYGRPSIITDVPMLSDLAPSSLVVSRGEPIDAPLRRLATDARLDARLGSEARKTACRLSWRRIIRDCKEVYERVSK